MQGGGGDACITVGGDHAGHLATLFPDYNTFVLTAKLSGFDNRDLTVYTDEQYTQVVLANDLVIMGLSDRKTHSSFSMPQ